MSLYDLGRPTGAMGGRSVSESERRSNRDSDLNDTMKRSKFMDYLMDAELRSEARKVGIARAKQTQEVIPHETPQKIEEAKLATQEAKANQTLVEPQRKEALRKLHSAMTTAQYDNVTRSYISLQENIRSGRMAPEDAYSQARAEIVKASSNPEATEQWLQGQGIDSEYTENALNSLMAMSNYGLHDAKQTRAEHLLMLQEELRLKLARQKAKEEGSKKAANVKYEPPSAAYLKNLEKVVSQSVTFYDDLNGSYDDESSSKGALVKQLGDWSFRARQNNILGDTGVVPEDLQFMGYRVINAFPDRLLIDNLGTNNSFDTLEAESLLNSSLLMMSAYRNSLATPEGAPLVSEVWKRYGPSIIQRMRDSQQTVEDQRVADSVERLKARQAQSDLEAQQRAEQEINNPKTSGQPPKRRPGLL